MPTTLTTDHRELAEVRAMHETATAVALAAARLTKARNDRIRTIVAAGVVPPSVIADLIGVTRSRLSQIARGEVDAFAEADDAPFWDLIASALDAWEASGRVGDASGYVELGEVIKRSA